jgi:hypothetical protein
MHDFQPVSASHSPEQLDAIWGEIKGRRADSFQAMSQAEPAGDAPAVRMLLDAVDATRDRRAKYGAPGEHFARTVGLINAALAHKLREPLVPSDWATIMILDKVARDQGPNPVPDNMVDCAGYAACKSELDAG